ALQSWVDLIGVADAENEHTLHGIWAVARGDGSIESLRIAFEELSILVIASIARHGNPTGDALFTAHCPMTFDWKGSDWIQTGREIRNPYFGAAMYRCGTIKAEVARR